MKNIETKVLAATLGSGLGAATGTLLLWFLGVVVWHVPDTADAAAKAVGAVPEPFGAWLVLVIGGLSAFLSGYNAPHTPRPDLHAATPVTTVVHNFTGDGSVADTAKAAAADLAFMMRDPAPATPAATAEPTETPAAPPVA